MEEQAPRRVSAYAPLRRLTIWAVFAVAAWFGFYCLHHSHMLGEQQFILLIFLLVPIGLFLLSGAGQDRSGGEEADVSP